MKKPLLSIFVISVLMISIFLGIWDLVPSAFGEQGPPNDSGLGMDATPGDNIWTTNGTWTIESGDIVTHSNKTIIINGDLQINGTLTLINVTLQMANATYDGQYNITVFDAGNLLITDLDDDKTTTADASVIESANAFRFGFQVTPGAQFELKNSELYDCGWSTSPFVDGFGLFINSDWANVTGNYITNAYRGIIIWESDNVTLANNTIDSVEYMGIYTNSAVECYIQYNTITNIPNYGIYLYSSLFLNVSYNNIIDNPTAYGISIDGGGGHDIYNNLIDNHDFGIFITADGSSYSTSFCYIFDNEISNNTRGIHIQGFDGTSAVQYMYIYNNQIRSNSEYAIFIYGDDGPFAVNNIYLFENEIFNNIDMFGGHAVRFYSNSLFGDVGIIFCNNNVIRDNSFSSSAGYHMRAVTDVFIWDEQLLRNKRNLWIDSSENVNVINSTLEKSTLALTLDAHIENKSGRGSSVYFLNTTFTPAYANVEDADSFLDVKRYLHVRVMRLGSGIDNANVWINDSLGNPDPDLPQPLSTGVGNNGWINWLVVSEFNKTSAQTISYTPHHIDARDGVTFGWADPTMDASKIITINLDTPPIVDDISVSDTSVLRTNQIFISANASDIEDSEELLTPHPQYKETSGSIWDNAYFGVPTYIGSAPSGYWQIPFIPSKTAPLGDYDIQIQFEDTASYFSDWYPLAGTVLVMNNLPYVEQSNNESSSVYRGQIIEIWVDGEDIEDGDDQNFSNANSAEFEYKANGSIVWEGVYLGNEYKDGTDWRVAFTPESTPSPAPLGYYDFRFRFHDNDFDWSTWFVKDDWIDVLNNPPSFTDIKAGNSDMFRGDSIWIFANGTDAEELESDLTVEIFYDEPGGGQVWAQTYLNNLIWDPSGFWKIQFSLPGNAPLGFYDFKIRFTDSDSGYNETIVNGLINVINSLPVPIDINPSSPTVSRGVGSIFLNVNAMDYEDAEDLLTIEVEYQLNNSGNWQSTYIGPQSYAGSPPSGYLRVTFQPDSGATLGFYDFRVRVIDTDLATSNNPEWIYTYNAVEVLSQIYTVDYLVIRDAPNEGGNVVTTKTYGVAEVDAFYAAGYNFTGDYVADVDVTWSSDDTLVGDVTLSGPSTSFTAQQVAADSTCSVTATYTGGITNSTGLLTVLAPEIDYLEIRSAPSGGGVNLGDPGNYPTYPVGHTETFYGALFNNSIGYLSDVPASSIWDTTDPSKVTVTSPGASSTISADNKNWGTVTITITDTVNILSQTTLVTVLEPTIDYIQINDGPDGGGTNLCDPANYPSYPVGYTTIYYGGYYNLTAGFIGPVPGTATWDSNDTAIVSVGSPGISSTITCSNSNFGTITITLLDGTVYSNTTQVTVLDVTIDYIQIRSQPGGAGLDLGDPANYQAFSVGHQTMFYAAAFNHTQGYIGDITVSWLSFDDTIVSVTSPGSSTIILCSDTQGGSTTISLNDGAGHQNSTQLTVLPPAVDYVQIRSAPDGGGFVVINSTHPVGGSGALYGAQYNHTAGFLGNVPFSSTWTSDGGSIVSVNSPSSYTIYTCNDTNYGTIIITLADGSGHTNSTEVAVLAPTMDYVVITDAPGGSGKWVGDRTYGILEEDTFYVVGYNNTAGFVDDVTGLQWSSDHTDVGNVTPTADTDSVTFSTQVVDVNGFCIVNVTFGGFKNSTGKLTVLSPRPDYIQIMDAPDNTGQILDARTFDVLEKMDLYVATFNSTTGFLYDVIAEFESSDVTIGMVENVTGWEFAANSSIAGGTCTITATYNGITTTSGTLTVLPPKVDTISILDAPNNEGNEVLEITLNESESIQLFLAGYNVSSGYVMDIPDATWTVEWALGSFTISDVTVTLTTRNAGSGEYSVIYQGKSITSTLNVNDITNPSPPGAPIKETAQTDEVIIEWTKSSDSDVETYIIERATRPDGPWAEIGTTDSDTTTFTDSDVEPETTYYYRVKAMDNASNPSIPSEAIKITTPGESAGLFDGFMLILLLIIIIIVVVVILVALLTRKGKGEPQEPEMEFEDMQAVAPQVATTRPPPPRRLAQKKPQPEKVVPKIAVTSEPAKSAPPAAEKSEVPPPPPPPPEDASKPEEGEVADKEKKKKAPPPPPPPPE